VKNPINNQDAATKSYIDALEKQLKAMNIIMLDAGYNGTVMDIDNDINNGVVYGKFYKRYAISSQKLCQSGWHPSTICEWIKLADLIRGSSSKGGTLKTADKIYWHNPVVGGTNSSGFSGFAGRLMI